MAGVMPHHFAGAPNELVHDVRFAAAGTNQRFTSVDAQRIDVDAGRHEEPLTLADEGAGVPAMEVGMAQTEALRDFADRAGHQAIFSPGHSCARDRSDKPMPLVESAQESLWLSTGILEAQHEVALVGTAIGDDRQRVG
jgi:hypothetical protein